MNDKDLQSIVLPWRVEEATYALVAGNLDNEPVPPESVEGWLQHIEKVARPDGDAKKRIELARFVLVTHNTTPVPPTIVYRWLRFIRIGGYEPCAGCGDRQLDDCHWACLGEEDHDARDDAVQGV